MVHGLQRQGSEEEPTIKDWLSISSRAIATNAPSLAGISEHLGERLAALLISRLPATASRQLIELLPDPPSWLLSRVARDGDRSIGYPDFVESASDTIGMTAPELCSPPEMRDELARRASDLFLVAVSEHVPPEILAPCRRELPAELTIRMPSPRATNAGRAA